MSTFFAQCNPPGGLTDIDYRDIQAFSESTAIVMGIDSPAMFWKTTDGGTIWTRVHFSDVIFFEEKHIRDKEREKSEIILYLFFVDIGKWHFL